MATLFERLLAREDYDTDGGYIPHEHFIPALKMHLGGAMTLSALKTLFSMTTPQAAEMDELLAARPAAPLLLLNLPAYVQWVDRVDGAITLNQIPLLSSTTSQVRQSCGMS